MRIASALIPSLLVAASAAVAAPDSQPAPASQKAPRPVQQDSGVASAWAGSSRTQATRWVSYAQDKSTDAACYTVFGELRCDRVPKKALPAPTR